LSREVYGCSYGCVFNYNGGTCEIVLDLISLITKDTSQQCQ
jgi:hypothetical protein